MKRAFVIALAIHLCLLLGAGYIYVLPPEKREKLFEMVKIKAPPKPAARKVRIAPPKKIRKPVPMHPVRRRAAKPIQLIAAKTHIVPEFTISLPEPSQEVYAPEVALVRLPEPVVTGAAESFWGKEIEMKEKEIELESFGLQNLQPVGTVENPVTQIIFQVVEINCAYHHDIGMIHPEQIELASNLSGDEGPGNYGVFNLGPFAIPPEEFVFYIRAHEVGSIVLTSEPLSSYPCALRIEKIGPQCYRYSLEDDLEIDQDYNDIVFTVTFVGAEGGF